jgi:hypothetical protein
MDRSNRSMRVLGALVALVFGLAAPGGTALAQGGGNAALARSVRVMLDNAGVLSSMLRQNALSDLVRMTDASIAQMTVQRGAGSAARIGAMGTQAQAAVQSRAMSARAALIDVYNSNSAALDASPLANAGDRARLESITRNELRWIDQWESRCLNRLQTATTKLVAAAVRRGN